MAELALVRRTDYSDNCPATVQRRCNMPHPSPIIFWLLLAATISIDAVAFSWAASEPDYSYGFVTFDALMLSQISVVCIWSGLSVAKSIWTRISPFLAVIVASLAWGMLGFEHFAGTIGLQEWMERTSAALVHQGLHAAPLLAMLWLFKRTAYWKLKSDSSAEWQFSVADLLIVMTIVAVLGAGIRYTEVFGILDWTSVGFIGSSAILALASVFIWSLWWTPLFLRLCGVIGVAIFLAAALSFTEEPFTKVFSVVIGTHYLIQALVLCMWLGCGSILPLSRASAADRRTVR